MCSTLIFPDYKLHFFFNKTRVTCTGITLIVTVRHKSIGTINNYAYLMWLNLVGQAFISFRMNRITILIICTWLTS